MCGIMGYCGRDDAVKRVLRGLEILEYRGYDSSGLAGVINGNTEIVKTQGRIEKLKEKTGQCDFDGCHTAIGHTRWATHGEPSDINAHPHRVGNVTLVHNGIIENCFDIKCRLEHLGYKYASETDTEVAAHLIDFYYKELLDPIEAIRKSIDVIKGSYAFAVIFEKCADRVFAVRRGSPLVIGEDACGYYLSSDITALLPFTKRYAVLREEDILCLCSECASIYTRDGVVQPNFEETDLCADNAEKNGYRHFMMKEICEQPSVLRSMIASHNKNGRIDFSCDGIDVGDLADAKSIHIVACGSAMYAGLVGAHCIERYAKIPTSVFVASEYRYRRVPISENTLVIAVSQSGETADTLAALSFAKESGCRTLAIVNAYGSAITKLADGVIYNRAGPEIAVATTKGYTTQISALMLIALALAEKRGELPSDVVCKSISDFERNCPRVVEDVISNFGNIKKMCSRIEKCEHLFYIGRGIDVSLSYEAALKLKEISYIHAEAYAAGELKHGTISLIEKGTPVIAIATDKELFVKLASNLREVRARGAFAVLVATDNISPTEDVCDALISIPYTDKLSSVFGIITAFQLIAYECACLRGCDVDKPRNLAKSVTVE